MGVDNSGVLLIGFNIEDVIVPDKYEECYSDNGDIYEPKEGLKLDWAVGEPLGMSGTTDIFGFYLRSTSYSFNKFDMKSVLRDIKVIKERLKEFSDKEPVIYVGNLQW